MMKMITAVDRIIMKSCSDNLTEFEPHTKLVICFKETPVTEKILYMLAPNKEREPTKWTNKVLSILRDYEKINILTLIQSGGLLLNGLKNGRFVAVGK